MKRAGEDLDLLCSYSLRPKKACRLGIYQSSAVDNFFLQIQFVEEEEKNLPPLPPAIGIREEKEIIDLDEDEELTQRPRVVAGIDVPELEARFSHGANEQLRVLFPRFRDVEFDDSINKITLERRHDYYLKKKQIFYSGCSSLSHDFFKAFDAAAQSIKSAAAKKNKTGKTAKDFRDDWDRTRDVGVRRHKGMECFLRHEPIPKKEGEEPSPAFYRMLAAHVDQMDVAGTEIIFYDEQHEIVGTCDVLFINRVTGKYVLGDYKNFKAKPVLEAKTKEIIGYEMPDIKKCPGRPGEYGTHHLTRLQLNSKFTSVTWQLNAMRDIATRCYGMEIEAMVVFVFPPEMPDDYLELEVPFMEMQPVFRYFPKSVRPPLVIEPVSEALPPVKQENPVPEIKISPYKKKPELEADDVWVCGAWKNGDYPEPSFWCDPNSEFQKSPTQAQLDEFELQLRCDPERIARLPELCGKNLLCWCRSPETGCHANVLQRYAMVAGRGELKYIVKGQ